MSGLEGTAGYTVGIDIGGSKTQAVCYSDGELLAEVLAGSANLASVGAVEAGRQLDAIFDQLGRSIDVQQITAICAGAAGVDTVEAELRLRDLIAQKMPHASVRIVHDTELILAAAGLDFGVALIAGTGSVAWGRTPGGRVGRAGGWGYLLGDEGSGYWIGREAVRHSLGMGDRGERPDRLAQQLAADCGLQRPVQLIAHFYAQPERRYWAGHSRLVFELAAGGDPAAAAILDAGADALAGLVLTVTGVLGEPLPVVLGGGVLMHQPAMQARVTAALKPAGLTDVRVLDRDPAHGAAWLAAKTAAARLGRV
jgi:N-acetylglucosamine kinase-like BadF-type ATPase